MTTGTSPASWRPTGEPGKGSLRPKPPGTPASPSSDQPPSPRTKTGTAMPTWILPIGSYCHSDAATTTPPSERCRTRGVWKSRPVPVGVGSARSTQPPSRYRQVAQGAEAARGQCLGEREHAAPVAPGRLIRVADAAVDGQPWLLRRPPARAQGVQGELTPGGHGEAHPSICAQPEGEPTQLLCRPWQRDRAPGRAIEGPRLRGERTRGGAGPESPNATTGRPALSVASRTQSGALNGKRWSERAMGPPTGLPRSTGPANHLDLGGDDARHLHQVRVGDEEATGAVHGQGRVDLGVVSQRRSKRFPHSGPGPPSAPPSVRSVPPSAAPPSVGPPSAVPPSVAPTIRRLPPVRRPRIREASVPGTGVCEATVLWPPSTPASTPVSGDPSIREPDWLVHAPPTRSSTAIAHTTRTRETSPTGASR